MTAIIISSVISVISIVIAVKSLKTTRQSIVDANKPYIAGYIDMVEVGHFKKYFIIKNFGRTPATIVDVQFSHEIKGVGRGGKIDSLIDSVLAPNQKAITAIDVNEKRKFSVTITYKDMQSNIMTYTYQLNSGFSEDLIYVDVNKSNISDDLNILVNLVHQYTKRNL